MPRVSVPTCPVAAPPRSGQLANGSTDQLILPLTPASSLITYPTQTMREIQPEDEKPKRNWLGMGSKPPSRPAPKPEPKPKPKPKPDPKPRHSAERERRQVRLAQNVRSHNPSKPKKKDDTDGCGCLILVGVIIAIGYFLFR